MDLVFDELLLNLSLHALLLLLVQLGLVQIALLCQPDTKLPE
jgi:hypothetical protein